MSSVIPPCSQPIPNMRSLAPLGISAAGSRYAHAGMAPQVKPSRAYGTARETAWEGRSSPELENQGLGIRGQGRTTSARRNRTAVAAVCGSRLSRWLFLPLLPRWKLIAPQVV